MFDFGFLEIVIILLVVLLVFGPERLPEMAAQFGRWAGKAKRVMASLRSDIERELKSAELKDMLLKQQDQIQELRSMLSETQDEIEEDLRPDPTKNHSDGALVRSIEDQLHSKQSELDLNSSPLHDDAAETYGKKHSSK